MQLPQPKILYLSKMLACELNPWASPYLEPPRFVVQLVPTFSQDNYYLYASDVIRLRSDWVDTPPLASVSPFYCSTLYFDLMPSLEFAIPGEECLSFPCNSNINALPCLHSTLIRRIAPLM